MKDEFNTIEGGIYSIEVKKSKFVSRGVNVSTEDDAKKIIKKMKKKYRNARHNVYAFSLLCGISRSSDDGEPPGTAGVQILKVIKRFNLKNVLIIVTRYFGGVLLGTGNLARAYSSCAQLMVENTKIVKNQIYSEIELELSYKEYNKILNSRIFLVKNVDFQKNVIVNFLVKKNEENKFKNNLGNLLSRNI